MPDKFSKETRSRIMSSIRSKDTKPEITIRRILWSHGKRYRIHDKSIFGTPDISSKKNKVAIFIDGCFWHGCNVCYKEPRTNVEYWRNKMLRNKKRRDLVMSNLLKNNWKIFQFWEHHVIRDANSVVTEILKFL